jgi:hypothetical protein
MSTRSPIPLRRPARRLHHLVGVACLAAQVWGSPVLGDDPGVLERQVKAAYLYKFTGYIQWPASVRAQPDMPFVIGVHGDDATADELGKLVRGRTVEGRPIEVRVVDELNMPEGIQMLYIARGYTDLAERLARRDPRPPVLVVTDAPGALKRGGMINFVLSEGRVRFEISLGAAERAGLSLSSRLLAVAHTVTRSP